MNTEKTYYTIDEVAKMSGRTRRTIERHIENGFLKSEQLDVHYPHHILKDDYEAYMEFKTAKPKKSKSK